MSPFGRYMHTTHMEWRIARNCILDKGLPWSKYSPQISKRLYRGRPAFVRPCGPKYRLTDSSNDISDLRTSNSFLTPVRYRQVGTSIWASDWIKPS